jgi:hypothetical protein
MDVPPKIEPSGSSGWRWPLVLLLIVVAGFLIASRTITQTSKSFAPTINNTTIINTSVTRLQQEAKFVVMTANIDVEVRRTSEKRAFYDLVDFGDTVATVRTRGNRAQYVVDLSHITDKNFKLEGENKRLVVSVPDPRVDDKIVEVQSDPSEIEIETEIGWGRLSARSGQKVRDEAVRALRQAVVDEARSAIYIKLAREHAEEKITDMLAPLTKQLGVTNVVIEFKFRKRTE